MSPEVAAMRRWLHAQLEVPSGGTVVDLGCGAGEDLRMLAEATPQAARFVGVERSERLVAAATEANTDPRVTYVCADAGARLPFADGAVDALYSVNLLECLPDKQGLLRECARILKPGGGILMAHWDWDTQTFDGPDRAAVRRILHAFNDWKQAWMEEIDPWAGRRLHPYFAECGAFEGEVRAYTMTSTSFAPDSYGYRQAQSFAALVRRGLVEEEAYAAFMDHQARAAERGAFFYSVTMYAYVGSKSRSDL
ncbi:MAG: methyltransferase domain-containing protein [Fimbriimonas sp.]